VRMEESSFGVIIEGSLSDVGMLSSEDSWGEDEFDVGGSGLGGVFGMTSGM
jgi:hypothetical protein